MTMPEKKYIHSSLTKRNKVLECSSYNNILKSANKMGASVTCIACKLKSDEAGNRSLSLSFTFTFTFNHLADAFIQSDVQMRRTIEAIRPSREQQYTVP